MKCFSNDLCFFSLTMRLLGELQINRVDLATKTLAKMKTVEEDNCLIVVS